jgi:hypothetical protein
VRIASQEVGWGPGIRAMPKHGTWGPWESADTSTGRPKFTETILFRVDIHNPSTINNVSAYTTGLTVSPIEIVPKDICLPAALRIVSQKRLSVRQNLTYSSCGIRGWEYKGAPPRCDCSKRQRCKDYQPQKRVTLVLHQPISCFSKILKRVQCQASFETMIADWGSWRSAYR